MDANVAKRAIVVALDGLNAERCRELVRLLGTEIYAFKIHDSTGRVAVWADLKLKDIPDTVALRARAVRDAGVVMLTVHASGGFRMMRAAVESGPPLIFAVTVLTSLDDAECARIHNGSTVATVHTLARMAKEAGAHGIVCSPQEVGFLSRDSDLFGMEFVTPGVRPAGAAAGDQARFDTPSAAIRAGATRLVIGRPITQAPDPVEALEAICEEIAQAMAERR